MMIKHSTNSHFRTHRSTKKICIAIFLSSALDASDSVATWRDLIGDIRGMHYSAGPFIHRVDVPTCAFCIHTGVGLDPMNSVRRQLLCKWQGAELCNIKIKWWFDKQKCYRKNLQFLLSHDHIYYNISIKQSAPFRIPKIDPSILRFQKWWPVSRIKAETQ